MANALEGTQPLPEGETALNPGNSPAPEQNDDEQHSDAERGSETEEIEGSAEGGEGGTGIEGTGEENSQEQQKPKKKLTWEMKRIHEETNKRREAERELERIREENERLRAGGSEQQSGNDRPDDESRVNQRAQQIVQQREYEARVRSWADAGVKDFGADDFNASCNLIAGFMDDRQQHQFMSILTDADIVEDGHKVIMALADDPEEAERILRLPPVKQALALSKLSAKVTKPAAPTPKPISKAPAPVAPIGGKTQASTRLDDPDVPMDKFAEKFLADMANRGR
ncbi:hypothetical protein ACFFP0_24570 [Rhizobium puerariae]|uniref:Scaffolding protein n=1 Tax=Rhizobium puerariae TaxID=1585791 RepID=A0ABV6AN42_9HYPH